MSSCLGLYIENGVIKYAKVTKDRDIIRIDSFGMKFYDNLDETVKQVISETYSYRIPISTNLSDEKYHYSELFSLLNKKDLDKAVDTEFEYFCSESGKNRNALEYRNLFVPNQYDKDKITSLYAYTDKSTIVGKLQALDDYKVSDISPLPLVIPNLNGNKEKKNVVIVNIENTTSVTTIINGQINKVDLIDHGMKEILESISLKENSHAKAYEICKNSTIYTSQGRNLQIEENEYLEDIMPVLYKIVEKTKEIILANELEISKIYITGLAAAINNIDLYFQENFPDKQCDILTPFFINRSNIKLNIKDYIEVNSAIALGLQGVGLGVKGVNFKRTSFTEKMSKQLGSIQVTKPSKEAKGKDIGNSKEKSSEKTAKIKDSFSAPLDTIEMMLLRGAIGVLVLIVLYIILTKGIASRINKKNDEIVSYIEQTQTKIEDITNYTNLVNNKTSSYESLIEKIDKANAALTESYARKNKIPNLLNEIGNIIPKGVQLLSVKNPTKKTIQIQAQATEYDQLGYFISKIKLDPVLGNVKVTETEKQNEYIKVTIEGDLLY